MWKKLLKSLNKQVWRELRFMLVCMFAGMGKQKFKKDFPAIYEHFKEFLFERMEKTFR